MAGCPLLAAYCVLETRRAGIEKLPFFRLPLSRRDSGPEGAQLRARTKRILLVRLVQDGFSVGAGRHTQSLPE
jgi:hypothetical protein